MVAVVAVVAVVVCVCVRVCGGEYDGREAVGQSVSQTEDYPSTRAYMQAPIIN